MNRTYWYKMNVDKFWYLACYIMSYKIKLYLVSTQIEQLFKPCVIKLMCTHIGMSFEVNTRKKSWHLTILCKISKQVVYICERLFNLICVSLLKHFLAMFIFKVCFTWIALFMCLPHPKKDNFLLDATSTTWTNTLHC